MNLLPQVDRYFKANLHTHTDCSDGKHSPEEVKALYKERGYQILAITDHEICLRQDALNDPDFLTLTAYELATTDTSDPLLPKPLRKTYHLNFIACHPDNRWQVFERARAWGNALNYADTLVYDKDEHREYSVDEMNGIIARANAHGFLCTYNHPIWSQQDFTDYIGLKGLWATEVFNNECYRQGYDDYGANHYQDLLRRGNRLMPIASDDFHRYRTERDIGQGWVMVGAQALTYESVFDALKKGDFYASTGPEITSLTLEGDTLRITCSEADHVDLIGHCRFCKRQAAKDQPITEATFDISPWRELCRPQDSCFLRLTVTDGRGRTAYTRAYFADEL